MKFSKAFSLEPIRRVGLCPSLLNLYVTKYSFGFLINDVLAGFKNFFLIIPINLAIAFFCCVSPFYGILSGAVATAISLLIGGSKYQITTIAFSLSVVTFEILAKYQYKGLLFVAGFATIFLFIMGIFRLSSIIKYMSYSLISALTICVSLSIILNQAQYLLEINNVQSSQNLIDNINIFCNNFHSITIDGLINFAIFVGPLVLMRMFSKSMFAYPLYLILWMVVAYLAGMGIISESLIKIDTTNADFLSKYIVSNISTVSFSETPQIFVMNTLNYAFAIAIVIAMESCFCINVSKSITGDTKLQGNIDFLSLGIMNFSSIAVGGLFVTPDTKLTMQNIRFKGRTIIPLFIMLCLFFATIFFQEKVCSIVPVFCLPAILLVFSLSCIPSVNLKNNLNPKNSDFYVFITTLISFLYFGFVSAVVCGFLVSALVFSKRMVNIKDAKVHTTKNHDTGATEFMLNKNGFSNSKNLKKETLDKIEVVQINNILHMNMLSVVRNALKARGNFPSVIIVYFKNVPFLDSGALSELKRFVKNVTSLDSIVIVSGTNGMLVEALRQKTDKEQRGQSYGYIVPSFDEALKSVIERLET